MKTGNALRLKSFEFAKRIIKLNEYLRKTHHAYTIADQILRSGTAIGAMIREAEFGESKKDFVHKLHVSLKETNETIYWLELIYSVDYISKIMFDSC